MNTYVFDASVVINVILKEDKDTYSFVQKITREIRCGKAKIVIPNFMLLELSNALRFKLLDKNRAQKAYLSFFKTPVEFQNFSIDQVLEIQNQAYELGTTVYDTSYHYLAKILDGTFVTCDKNYYSKAKSWGNIKLV